MVVRQGVLACKAKAGVLARNIQSSWVSSLSWGQSRPPLDRVNLGGSYFGLRVHLALGLLLSSQERVDEGFEEVSPVRTRTAPFHLFHQH